MRPWLLTKGGHNVVALALPHFVLLYHRWLRLRGRGKFDPASRRLSGNWKIKAQHPQPCGYDCTLKDVAELIVFQRTPNLALLMRQRKLDDEANRRMKETSRRASTSEPAPLPGSTMTSLRRVLSKCRRRNGRKRTRICGIAAALFHGSERFKTY
jgi:hypothetical protein